MKKSLVKIMGVLLLLIGFIFIFSSFSKLTGNIVAEKITGSIASWIGLVFLVGGFAFFLMGKEKGREGKLETNLAQQVINDRKIITKSRDLINISKKMGYQGRQVKEGYQVLGRDGKPLTVIPRHKEVSGGVYQSVIEALATGESSFRKRNINY